MLIVDDTDSVASALAVAFEFIPGVKAVIANSSLEALKLFTAEECGFSAVVTDLHLPSLNGIELIREIRSITGYKNLPAILITADERVALNSGTVMDGPNAVFHKPCSLKEVSRALEELLA
ncbi:MAG TPA: response regulator [Bryobacteraceae bacterium]|nr:response regulator [Bryobacteraceae bacterium]